MNHQLSNSVLISAIIGFVVVIGSTVKGFACIDTKDPKIRKMAIWYFLLAAILTVIMILLIGI